MLEGKREGDCVEFVLKLKLNDPIPCQHLAMAKWLFEEGFDYYPKAVGYDVTVDPDDKCKVHLKIQDSIGGDSRPDVECKAGLTYTSRDALQADLWQLRPSLGFFSRLEPGVCLELQSAIRSIDGSGPYYQHTVMVNSKVTKGTNEEGQPTWDFWVFHSMRTGIGPEFSYVTVTAAKKKPFDAKPFYWVKIHGIPNPLELLGYHPRYGYWKKTYNLDYLRVTGAAMAYATKCVRVHVCGEVPRRDPVVFDLDGYGIHTIGLDADLHFDHDGDGFRELTGWVDGGAGVLFLDRNGNNKLDDGSELFGDDAILPDGRRAADGFGALAFYDADGDGMVDASDPVWSELRMWQGYEYNASYTGDPHELGNISTLDELGITAIDLDYTDTNITDEAGNTEVRSGQFIWADGSSGTFAEYSFDTNVGDTEVVEEWDVPPDISALPQLYGVGRVRHLHQVMAQDSSGELKALVEAFASETNADDRASIMHEVILKWTGADKWGYEDMWKNLGFPVNPQIIALLLFCGMPFSVHTYKLLNSNEGRRFYQEICEVYYADLMAQTHLKDLYDSISYTEIDTAPGYRIDTTALVSKLQGALDEDYEQGKLLLSEFARSRRALGYFDENCFLSLRETFIQQDPELGWVFDTGGLPVIEHVGQGDYPSSPYIRGTAASEAIRGSLTEGTGWLEGGDGIDVIYGTDRDEVLSQNIGYGNGLFVGGGGDDKIMAYYGTDILDGGEGRDELWGEAGNDVYIFRPGSGQDAIIERDSTPGNTDTLWLGGNLRPEDVILLRSAYDVVLKIEYSSDVITIRDFFRGYLYQIEQIQFMDGTLWTHDEIVQRATATTAWDDIIYGGEGDDLLHGAGGSDIIFGFEGADILKGDEGYDQIWGGPGDDILEGGINDDSLNGGPGNDTFVFNSGYGHDVIRDADETPGDIDTLELGAGILPADVSLERVWGGSGPGGSYDGFKLTIAGTNDSIEIRDWLDDGIPRYGVEIIHFSEDGTVWGTEEIQDMLVTGSDADDFLVGFARADTITGGEGADTLHGRQGDDTIDGGPGGDTLFGESGNDMLSGDAGEDILAGGQGDDTLDGRTGNDILQGGRESNHGWDNANGDDVYLFHYGSGCDTIIDHDRTAGNTDTIRRNFSKTPGEWMI